MSIINKLLSTRLSFNGVHFNAYGTEVSWLAPWGRNDKGLGFYLPKEYISFKSLREVKTYLLKGSKLTRNTNKIQGITFDELLEFWVSYNSLNECVVVVTDINYDSKPAHFWEAIPIEDRYELIKDAVLFRCKDKRYAMRLIDSIPSSFGIATGYYTGITFYSNSDIVDGVSDD